MPRKSPYHIVLSPDEERELERRAAKYTLPYFQVLRAKMILLAAQDLPNDEIGARLDARREIVCLWRKRFFENRLPGLDERPRPGRPRAFPPQRSSLRSRRWRVNCLAGTAFPFRASARLTWPANSVSRAWWPA